jgi:flagellar motor protein MotB
MNRLKYIGFGSLKPIYKIPEQNEVEEQVNRRVEILILDN